jgi:isoleucyl-tRNA synthetase
MSDYTQEVHLSKEILSRVVEAYRKIRNTLRFLLGNLYDFDPAVDPVEVGRLEEVDRYILARYAGVAASVLGAYDEYSYGTIFQAVNAFTTLDLSAFYENVSKDRLYTFAARSVERRSAQTAMYLMADGLTRLIAPILSFTADELWRHLPGTREESVHMAVFPSRAAIDALADPELVDRWSRLIAIRERVVAEMEPLRKDKRIGSSLQAKVVLSAAERELAFLAGYAGDLPMLFIVSDVELRTLPTRPEEATAGAGGPHQAGDVRVTIERADGTKCERCWRYVDAVSTDPASAGLCERCRDVLAA